MRASSSRPPRPSAAMARPARRSQRAPRAARPLRHIRFRRVALWEMQCRAGRVWVSPHGQAPAGLGSCSAPRGERGEMGLRGAAGRAGRAAPPTDRPAGRAVTAPAASPQFFSREGGRPGCHSAAERSPRGRFSVGHGAAPRSCSGICWAKTSKQGEGSRRSRRGAAAGERPWGRGAAPMLPTPVLSRKNLAAFALAEVYFWKV